MGMTTKDKKKGAAMMRGATSGKAAVNAATKTVSKYRAAAKKVSRAVEGGGRLSDKDYATGAAMIRSLKPKKTR